MVLLSICVLCGLPGSGKTTLSLKIKKNSDFQTIHICYDQLIQWIDQTQTNLKEERRKIVEFVQYLIKLCKCNIDTKINDNIQSTINLEEARKLVSECKGLTSVTSEVKVLFLIDDNMQYSGMRHEYYKLAQANSTGFSIIYTQCLFDICKGRIDKREHDEKRKTSLLNSLLRINAQMEIPGCCNWEKNIFQIVSTSSLPDFDTKKIYLMLNNTFKNPLHLIKVNEKEILKIKLININNVKHQSDILLRKIIGNIMKTNKKLNYKFLLELKTKVLNDIKDINVDSYFIDQNLKSDLLNKKVNNLFNAYLNEQTKLH